MVAMEAAACFLAEAIEAALLVDWVAEEPVIELAAEPAEDKAIRQISNRAYGQGSGDASLVPATYIASSLIPFRSNHETASQAK